MTPQGKVICDCGQQLSLFEDNVIAVEVIVTPEGLKVGSAIWNKVDLNMLLLAIKKAEEEGHLKEVTPAIKRRLAELIKKKQTA